MHTPTLRGFGLLTLLFLGRLSAAEISVDIGPSGLYAQRRDFVFNDLVGTPFQGQTSAFDIRFANDSFVRLFPGVPPDFSIGFNLFTTFLPGGTLTPPLSISLYPIDSTGAPLGPPMGFSTSGRPQGFSGVGTAAGITTPLDFFGIHVELTLPSLPGASVTGARFSFVPNGIPYAVGPGVATPDSGVTV